KRSLWGRSVYVRWRSAYQYGTHPHRWADVRMPAPRLYGTECRAHGQWRRSPGSAEWCRSHCWHTSPRSGSYPDEWLPPDPEVLLFHPHPHQDRSPRILVSPDTVLNEGPHDVRSSL